MSNTVSDLIGRMVHGPVSPVEPAAAALQALAAERPTEPLHVLIGRIIYPHGGAVVSHTSSAVAPPAEPASEMGPVIAT